MAIRFDGKEGLKQDIMLVCDSCFDHVSMESKIDKSSYGDPLPSTWSSFSISCSFNHMPKGKEYSDRSSRRADYHFCGKCIDNEPEITFKRTKNTWIQNEN
jgi:hypothetical protein